MIAGVADTHAAIWYLSGDPNLSATTKVFFDQAASARQKIVLSPISLAEVVYLVEKKRLPVSAFDDLKAALRNPNHVLQEAPFTSEVVEAMRTIPRDDVPDMPDRIVSPPCGTAGLGELLIDVSARLDRLAVLIHEALPGFPTSFTQA